ncbi:hypothetical protein COLO4_33442, partial [Corchorus olitorius]
MWCGVKYSPGHSCLHSNLFSIQRCGEDDTLPELDEPIELFSEITTVEADTKEATLQPVLSMHALMGTSGPQTMRVIGVVKNQKVIILMDFGSSHNFMDAKIVKKLGCPKQAIH